ncbi:hypothetical protein HAV15_002963 [Penicillium sp. str. |nr:hypothetical protein HAV15_002963 [Penicillium sp. str. \
MPLISRQPTHRAGEELDTMPLLVRRPNTRPSRKSKGANSPAQSTLQRGQPTLRLRLQQRCVKPEAWWTSLTAFGVHDDISEHMLEHEKAIAMEETRQKWMRRLRPMPHRQNPLAKKGKEHKRS